MSPEPGCNQNQARRREAHAELLGVYVHVPFCLSKCGYCDFASQALLPIPHAIYADAVLRELEARAPTYLSCALRSLYFGGGTPSLWDPAELRRVVAAVRDAFMPSSELEITVEVNPGTVDEERLRLLRDCGVTRLSVGVQSLDDRMLEMLGRVHNAGDARRSMTDARRVGFVSVSCDLMFGLPGQTLSQHLEQLRQLLDLGPDHVSAYALTLSPGAPLRRAGLVPAPDELQAEMMERGRELLEAAGLSQYEVSNFASRPHRSVHNSLTWEGRPYLGLGASAHSMWPDGPRTIRVANPPLAAYLGASANQGSLLPAVSGAEVELVAERDARCEVVFLGLRTVEGVSREAFRRRFNVEVVDWLGAPVAELASKGFLRVDERSLAPTPMGIWFADELALRLLP